MPVEGDTEREREREGGDFRQNKNNNTPTKKKTKKKKRKDGILFFPTKLSPDKIMFKDNQLVFFSKLIMLKYWCFFSYFFNYKIEKKKNKEGGL